MEHWHLLVNLMKRLERYECAGIYYFGILRIIQLYIIITNVSNDMEV
jgi:hypothetical protein